MFGGYPPTAIGYPPTAIGYPPTAIGYTPTAIGYPPTAIGYPPTAIGYPPTAISYPPAAIIGRIGHSEFFFFIFIMATPAQKGFQGWQRGGWRAPSGSLRGRVWPHAEAAQRCRTAEPH